MALAVQTALRRLEVRRMYTKQRVLGAMDDLPINLLQREPIKTSPSLR